MKYLDEDFSHIPGVKEELIKAQRAWIKFRDADCEFQYKMHEDGTIRMIIYPSCLHNHTKQRNIELQNLMLP